jgi:hypothetical protein
VALLSLSFVYLLNNPLPHRMRMPHQHPDVPVPADRSDLGRGQAHFEEAADGFVAEGRGHGDQGSPALPRQA